MKETGIIKIEKRTNTNSRASKRLREAGSLPGNVCGKGIESVPVIVRKDEFKKTLSKYGRNSVFKLDMGGDETYNVIVKEIQYSPVSREYVHVDFQQVSFSEEIKTDVSIRIVGKELIEAKRLLLLRHMDFIPVKGLPQNLPDVIELDVSGLQAGESMTVGDMKLPEGITSEIDLEQLIVSVSESKTQVIDEESSEEIVSA